MTAPAQPVIDGLRVNREKLRAFCDSLSEDELNRLVPPDNAWTVKDFLIHLLTFDDLTAEWVEGVIAGDTSAPTTVDGGIDAWNNRRVAEWRGKSLDDIFAASANERARFESVLERLSQEQMDTVVHFPGDNKRDPGRVPIGLFLHGLARHDPVHVADIVKALPERANDPDLKAWLDDRMVQWYQQAMSRPAKR
jgi:DinB superfamily